jgi:hypothetical protein
VGKKQLLVQFKSSDDGIGDLTGGAYGRGVEPNLVQLKGQLSAGGKMQVGDLLTRDGILFGHTQLVRSTRSEQQQQRRRW